MASRRRQEGGKKANAEGRHGDRTHAALQEQLKHGLPKPVDPALRDTSDGEHQEPDSTSGENK